MARIKEIDKLTFKDMIFRVDQYGGLADGLIKLPCVRDIKIGRVRYNVPQDLDEFSNTICYGQRLYLARGEKNDLGVILRVIKGYYYPFITNEKWDEEQVLLLQKKVLNCKVKELYPVAMHLITLISEVAERETKLLHKEPSKVEKAAGIEKLNLYAELNALDFLRDTMKIPISEVLLTPYNECLVRFMSAKELADYQERYFELMRKDVTPDKSKFTK